MIIRKSVSSLTSDEKASFVHAMLELKRIGKYDAYVGVHHHIMTPTVMAAEPNDYRYRNGAHRGPAFLPWHRQFLLLLEAELREIEPTLSLPFWDWTKDAVNLDPTKTPAVWADDFMGGNGLSSDNWRVQTGPFAHKNGKWPVPEYKYPNFPSGPGLKRQFGMILPSLPTAADVKLAMDEIFFDTPDYN